jgi:hypothetical protein
MKFMSYLVVAPLQVALCLYLIYTQVGNAMFVGIGFMMFLVPLQGLVFGTMFKYQKIFLKKVDRKCLFLLFFFSSLVVVFFYFFPFFFFGFCSVRWDDLNESTHSCLFFSDAQTYVLFSNHACIYIYICSPKGRVGLLSEVLSGIRIVKYYAWEKAFEELVAGMRQEEIAVLTRMACTFFYFHFYYYYYSLVCV